MFIIDFVLLLITSTIGSRSCMNELTTRPIMMLLWLNDLSRWRLLRILWWSSWSSCWLLHHRFGITVLMFNLVLTCLIYLCQPSKDILIRIRLKWLCGNLCPCVLLCWYILFFTMYKSSTFFYIVILYSRWLSLLHIWFFLFLICIYISFRWRWASFIIC